MSGVDPVARGLAAQARIVAANAAAAAGAGSASVTVAKPWTFTVPPEAHGIASDASPIDLRAPFDGKTVGLWNGALNAGAGDIFHFATGVNTQTPRSVTDLVTTGGSAIVTSASAAFVNANGANGSGGDLGKVVVATGVPAGTIIASIQSATQATLSAVATASASGVSATIGLGNPNGYCIAIGVDNGAGGITVRNKYSGNGIVLQQLDTVISSASYAMYVQHYSHLSPAVRIGGASSAGVVPALSFAGIGTPAAGQLHMNWRDPSGVAGVLRADTGILEAYRPIQSLATTSTGAGTLRVASESATTPTEAALVASTAGDTGVQFYRYAGTGATFYASKIVATSDRLKLQIGNGAQTKGAESYATMIEARGFSTGQTALGFFGASPAIQAGAGADLKTALVGYGLIAAAGSATPLNLEGGNLSAGLGSFATGVNVGNGGAVRGVLSDGTTIVAMLSMGGTGSVTLGGNSGNTTVNGGTVYLAGGGTAAVAVQATLMTLLDGVGLAAGTTNGSRIATAATQKIGFWGAAPVVRQTGIPAALPTDGSAGNAAIATLLNWIRQTLVTTGLAA